MSEAKTRALWLRLQAEGLVAGELPASDAATSPWFVRVMLGIAGWIGALFLLGFVGASFEFLMRSSGAAFVVGVIACSIAGALFRAKPDSDFTTQFCFAFSLAGQGLMIAGLGNALHQTGPVALGTSLFELVLFAAIPNFVHRVWTATAGAGAIAIALADWHLLSYAPGLLAMACAWVWLKEFSYPRHGALLRSGGYGLVLALAAAVAIRAWNNGGSLWYERSGLHHESPYAPWIGAILGGIALLGAVRGLLRREGVEPASHSGLGLLAAAGIVALAALKAPGLAPASLVLLLGYGNGNRVLAGLGVVALLGYLSIYYYSLEATLLYKAAVMAAAGLALLAARLVLHWAWSDRDQGEKRHA
jgi:hypothetical protein